MKKVLMTLTLLITMLAFGQEQETNDLSSQISVRFSNLTGYGLAYNYHFMDDYAIRTTAWFKYYERVLGPEGDFLEKETNKNYNFGLELQRDIFEQNKYRIFGFGGCGYAIKENTSAKKDEPINQDQINDKTISMGAGFGMEYFFINSLSVDLGLSYKFDIYEGKKYVYDKKNYVDETVKESGLGASVGINFNF